MDGLHAKGHQNESSPDTREREVKGLFKGGGEGEKVETLEGAGLGDGDMRGK